MLLRHENVLALVEKLFVDNDRSKCMGISDLDNIGFYTATTEEQPNFIRAQSNVIKNRNIPAFFAGLHFTSA